MPHVVIVGAGIAGLAAAHALRDVEVTVIDASNEVGGKLRTSPVAGIEVDEGAEMFLVRVPEARTLADDLGVDVVHPATTSASVWVHDQLQPLPTRTVFGVPSALGSLRGILSAPELLRASVDLVQPAQSYDGDASVAEFVGHRLGAAVVDRLVDPLLGGVYAGRASELSVRATMPQLAGVRGSLIRATRDQMAAASDGGPVFATVPGGLGRFAADVAAASGARLVLGRPVRAIERRPDGFRLVHGSTVDEQAIDADAVVVAVPAAPAARLLAGVTPSAASELAGIDAASMVIVTTAWPAEALRGVGSGYLVPAVSGRLVKAVTFASQKWPHLDNGDLRIVRCSIGRHGSPGDVQRDDAELVAAAVEELRHSGCATGSPVESRVTRWGGALPQYAVGHVDRVRRIYAAVDAVPGLAVCGASYEGVGIPACIRSAHAAVRRIRDSILTRS